jgi:hypothetical protein
VTTRKPRRSRRTSPSFRHSARSLGRSPDGWAPSTPPPSNEVFAALTIASDLQARDVADRQTEARLDINRSHSCGLSRSRLRVRPRRLIRGLRPRPVKKDRSRHAGSGQVAGGKPATGRLCQAGLKKMKAGVRHPACPANRRASRLFHPRADGVPGYAARCPFVLCSPGYRTADARLFGRPATRRPRLTAMSERPAAPSNRWIGRLRPLSPAITVSASPAWLMPVNWRYASRPRESRERTVPTRTSRTAATSP